MEVEKRKEEHKALKSQLDNVVRKHNDEISLLVKRLDETNNRRGRNPLSLPTNASTEKHYDPFNFDVAAKRMEGQWFLCCSRNQLLDADFRFLIDWLEVALGGTGVSSSCSPTVFSGCSSLKDENRTISSRDDMHSSSSKSLNNTCWRKKILSGNILGAPLSTSSISKGKTMNTAQFEELSPPTPLETIKDGLLLSASALWSLFDNSLERVPSCGCTFKAGSNDFIQCKAVLEGGKWLLWHTFSNMQPCTGQDCDSNQRVALAAGESGIRLFSTSPCVLGWAGKSRVQPSSPLWKTLSVTDNFRRKPLIKYEVTEFQAQAQLSIPTIVTPQIGGAVTFSKRNYEIANTIDNESILAMGKAAELVVLIYDEKKGIHLACDGADLIEILCVHYLRDMGRDASGFLQFNHPNALLRLPTWYQSRFISPMGICFTGDQLIREATKGISKLVEVATSAAKKDSELLYWLLEDILCGSGSARKAPSCKTEISWHKLAFKKPPLILAVGELGDGLLTLNNDSILWLPSSIKHKKSLFGFSGLSRPHPSPGAIVGTHENVRRWLLQAQPFYCATLEVTADKVMFGPNTSESTYKVVESTHAKNGEEAIFSLCQDCKKRSEASPIQCLHYIQ